MFSLKQGWLLIESFSAGELMLKGPRVLSSGGTLSWALGPPYCHKIGLLRCDNHFEWAILKFDFEAQSQPLNPCRNWGLDGRYLDFRSWKF